MKETIARQLAERFFKLHGPILFHPTVSIDRLGEANRAFWLMVKEFLDSHPMLKWCPDILLTEARSEYRKLCPKSFVAAFEKNLSKWAFPL